MIVREVEMGEPSVLEPGCKPGRRGEGVAVGWRLGLLRSRGFLRGLRCFGGIDRRCVRRRAALVGPPRVGEHSFEVSYDQIAFEKGIHLSEGLPSAVGWDAIRECARSQINVSGENKLNWR